MPAVRASGCSVCARGWVYPRTQVCGYGETREIQRLLDEALAQLDEKHRVVFLLRDVEGLSVKETDEILGLSESNTQVRLLRARLQLREQLTRTLGDPATQLGRSPHHQH